MVNTYIHVTLIPNINSLIKRRRSKAVLLLLLVFNGGGGLEAITGR